MNTTAIWTIAIIISSAFLIASILTNKNASEQNEINSQFECGFNLINTSNSLFSFQFFLVSLLFLIFDIEVAVLTSYPLEPNSTNNLINAILFLIFLTGGLVYEWQNSNISWSNWMGKFSLQENKCQNPQPSSNIA